MLLSAKMHLLRLTPILHMKQHFFLHRTGQPTRIALLYLRIRYGSASTTKIIKTIVIFFLLNQTCCYVDIIVMALAGNPPLQALWIICSNFLPLSAYNFIAAFCNCLLIGYIIPLSVRKSNIWHSASFFLFTTNIAFVYCVFTCSFYISDGIIPSLRHIQFDMIKRCCTFLCSAAIIY